MCHASRVSNSTHLRVQPQLRWNIQAGSRVVVKEKSAMTGLASPLEAVITTEQDSVLTMGAGKGRNDQVFW